MARQNYNAVRDAVIFAATPRFVRGSSKPGKRAVDKFMKSMDRLLEKRGGDANLKLRNTAIAMAVSQGPEYLAVNRGGRLAGAIATSEGAGTTEVQDLGSRHRGVGKKLMGLIENDARNKKHDKVVLTPVESAIGFYSKLGYKPVSGRHEMYKDVAAS